MGSAAATATLAVGLSRAWPWWPVGVASARGYQQVGWPWQQPGSPGTHVFA